MLFMPESPFYELKKGRVESAKKSLKWLKWSESDEQLESVFKILEKELEAGNKISAKTILKSPGYWRPCGIMMGLMFFHCYCGYYAVENHLSEIVDSSGTSLTPDTADIAMKSLLICGCIGTMSIVDRVGRRPLLIISCGLMALGLLGMAVYFTLEENRYVDCAYFNSSGYDVCEENLEGFDNDVVDAFSWMTLVCI